MNAVGALLIATESKNKNSKLAPFKNPKNPENHQQISPNLPSTILSTNSSSG
jgi:hypothetical protein